jgi:pyridoxamine 5'-phosphate oxidase
VATAPDTALRERPLRRSDLADDPRAQFDAWLREARELGIDLPEAAALATASADGAPSVRMVLLKEVAGGLGFFTGYESRKGAELAANARVAACVYWNLVGRQVRVEGRVERLPAPESDAYFASRPAGSRISAAVSSQSTPVAGRAELEEAAAALARAGGDVARPASWGGFRLLPERWEFWQHRADRLHDRFLYEPADHGWTIVRLAP